MEKSCIDLAWIIRRRFRAPLALVAALAITPLPAATQDLDASVAHALQFARQQLAASVAQVADPNRFPRSTRADGSWRTKDSGSWTSGFFPGCLWFAHESSGGGSWSQWAGEWTAAMEDEKNDTSSHDVGFKILCSFGNAYRLLGTPAHRDVIVRGAQSLSTRYNAVVGCTRSWNNWHFPVIIDNMMNLEILFWAASHGGDPAWRDMAISHALRTRADHVRADGSTYHLVDYDASSGAILSRGTVQGFSNSSTWARGQAWAVHGFTMAYRETGDARLLATARQVSDWFIDHLPADHVPYWDFDAPNIPNEPRDTSAAAIAAAGLLELGTLDSDPFARQRYRAAAFDILSSLCSAPYLTEGTSSGGILLHGVGNRPANSEVDVSLIYGDYYFLEALLRYGDIVTASPLPARPPLLVQNRPNPFNPSTRIDFVLPRASRVQLEIFDARGAAVRSLLSGELQAGEHHVHWNGRATDGSMAASGTYIYQLRAGDFVDRRKMTLVR